MFNKIELEKKWTEHENQILDFWEKNDIFIKSVSQRENKNRYVFYEGPPTANGKPGIHHVLARIFKDIICRYKTMDGYYVPRIGGWDTHGLPVELEIEKKLKISGKNQIESYGIDKFVEECKNSVFTYKKDWDYLTKRIGYWVDLDHPYITCSNDYIESVWWALKEIFNKGLLFEDYKVVPHCPRCETTLSSHEVAQGYKENTPDPSVYVKFKLEDEADTYFLVWTTTPWTLTANVAIAVGTEIQYVKIKVENNFYILAKDRLKVLFEENTYEIVSFLSGTELLNKRYSPPYNFYNLSKEAFFVIGGKFVGLDEGTGIVHIAPAFGIEDMEVGKENNLPTIISVNSNGTLKEEITPFKNLFIKDADKLIINDLKARNIIFKYGTIKHTYPFCWRCDSPLVYIAKSSYFIKVSSIRDQLKANNDNVNWIPSHIKNGRFGEWISEAKDWALSRERYWGTPLNVWVCSSCKEKIAIGSIDELKEKAVNKFEEIELHRPYIDSIELRCPECNGKMFREKYVLDCWFDSGSMPFAQFHYPFENKEKFKLNFPSDFISEGIDHTRGWFYVLHVINTIIFGESPFKNVLTLELILDEKGEKMSKSRGNAVDPFMVIDNYGTDSLRWSTFFSSTPWIPRKFNVSVVSDALKNFIIPILNSLSFLVTYANIDKYNPDEINMNIQTDYTLDKWIISRINNVIKNVRRNMDNFLVTEAAREISIFIDDLTNWYIRRSRRRFWKSENDKDKSSAYSTLLMVLYNLSILIAPFTPFISEYIYQIIKSGIKISLPLSVHLLDYPEVNNGLINKELEEKMSITREIISSGLRARKNAKIRARYPLSNVYIIKKVEFELEEEFYSLILSELNIKDIKFSNNLSEFALLNIKPNLPVLGKKYGNKLPLIINALKNITDPYSFKDLLEKESEFNLNIGKEIIVIGKEDLFFEINGKESVYIVEDSYSCYLAIDIRRDQALIEEGFAREFCHFIQNLRKDSKFSVDDRITIYLENNDLFNTVINNFKTYIKSETLAENILPLSDLNKPDSISYEFDFDSGKVGVAISRLSS